MSTIRTSTRLSKTTAFGIAVTTWLALGFAPDGGKDVGAHRTARGGVVASDHRTAPTHAAADRLDRIDEAYGRLPISFERNGGQTDPRVEFLARGKGYTLFLTKGAEAVMSLRAGHSEAVAFDSTSMLLPSEPGAAMPSSPPAPTEQGEQGRTTGAVLKLRLVGARVDSSGQGLSRLPGKVNYLVGGDHSVWRGGIATYGKVQYREVYPGIDLVFYGNQRELEYDFLVKPGADPNAIVLEFEGADRLAINRDGELVATLGEREVVQRTPVVYQDVDGFRREVSGRYVLLNRTRAAFEVEGYDRQHVLVIDPVLVYSTYLDGTLSVGSGSEGGAGVAVDASGNVYVTGATDAVEFPTTAGAYEPNWNGGSDAFVTKLDANGSGLVYSTYLGGSSRDGGTGIALDAAGSAYVTGLAVSADFPATAGAFDTSWNGGNDVFVTKLDPEGALVYATFLGGSTPQVGPRIAADADGSAYITGTPFSADFPTTAGAFDTTVNGNTDIFVTKLDPSGAALVYSTYLGGSSNDQAWAIAVDTAGSAYITGSTSSADFPTTPGAFDTTKNGGFYYDAFVTKVEPGGAALVYSTYLGGTYNDHGHAIAVDAAGSAYVTGRTENSNFPTTVGAFDTSRNGYINAFVTKLDASGAALTYSTYLGGERRDESHAITVDAGGNAYITGFTESSTFPTTSGAFDSSWNQSSGPLSDVFVTKLDFSGAALVYSTYLGGSSTESGLGVAVDAAGGAYVAGSTGSADFPTTGSAFDTSWNGGSDVFVTKLDPSGTALGYSTYLGGTFGGGGAAASGLAVAVDVTGSAYVTGTTATIDFPTTTGVWDTNLTGRSDVFITKLTASGAELVYSTYLGGSGDDVGAGIAVDATGSAYVTGYIFSFGASSSADFPTTAGAFDTSWNGGYYDSFVTKLDPSGAVLEYSTYLGGSGWDLARGIAVDARGSAYVTGHVTGQTGPVGFPTTPGAFDTSWNGAVDAFVTKLNPTGAALAYSTYLGGGSNDYGASIAVDAAGSAYVTGYTASVNFPTTLGALDTSWNGNGYYDDDVFITKLDRSGASLAYSTYLGGSAYDYATSIAVDPGGDAYVTGYTASANFPTTPGAFDTSWNGSYDVFVTEVDRSGAVLTYSTYLGGSDDDRSQGIAVDAAGSASLTGRTASADFPTTAGGLDTTWNGSPDAFIIKLAPGGAALEYSTYLGGSADDSGSGIALDARGDVYLVGSTDSQDIPTTAGAFDSTPNGQSDAFVVKLSFGRRISDTVP